MKWLFLFCLYLRVIPFFYSVLSAFLEFHRIFPFFMILFVLILFIYLFLPFFVVVPLRLVVLLLLRLPLLLFILYWMLLMYGIVCVHPYIRYMAKGRNERNNKIQDKYSPNHGTEGLTSFKISFGLIKYSFWNQAFICVNDISFRGGLGPFFNTWTWTKLALTWSRENGLAGKALYAPAINQIIKL